MPETCYRYSGRDHSVDPSIQFRGSVLREFYRAQAYFKGDVASLRVDSRKSIAGPLAIFATEFDGRALCGVQRSAQDIQLDSKQLFLLWFPIVGTVRIHQNHMEHEVGNAEFAITYANRPLRIEACPDALDRHVSYQVALPAHLIGAYLPRVDHMAGSCFPLDEGNAAFAKQTYLALFEKAEAMSPKAVGSFVTASLEALCESIQGDYAEWTEANTVKSQRARALRNYVDLHLSDPGLTATHVAKNCGMSVRYLHQLFQESGASFHDYTWNRRLDRAHAWLTLRDGDRVSVSHVAYAVGFRNLSHFSRAFKSAYGCKPTEARAGGQRTN